MRTRVVDVGVEHRAGLGIGVAAPRVSWRTETDVPDWTQRRYEIAAVDTVAVESRDSVLVPWPGRPLRSRQRELVRVRVTGSDGLTSDWSDPVVVEAGLLDPSDWSARFVSPVEPIACPYLRRQFAVGDDVVSARLYASALGVYELTLNGATVGDHVLAPGWTSYGHRLHYDTFDVGALLRPGDNSVGAVLAEGWYRGRLGFGGGRSDIYGDRVALVAQLEITYADGTIDVIATDDTWQAAAGPLVAAGLYDGETYDARISLTTWGPVEIVDRPLAGLVARVGPPVRRTEEVSPVGVSTSPSGRTVVDFGQNLVGRLRIRVAGDAGTRVTLRHAEVLEHGELCTAPLRHAAATDRYTLAGTGEVEEWEPRFTTHGFRYADIEGWPASAPPVAAAVTAVVCHSDMERTGWFECSDDRITRLHQNVVWGMRGNFVDVPTDCPQRDERLGWTGDIAMFSPTACFLYDAAGFLSSWLRDLAADQRADGAVPPVIPSIFEFPPTAAWGDAAVIVPWVVYQRSGDVGVLATQYPSMRAWVDHVLGLAGESRLWNTGFQFADWLDPAAPPEHPQLGKTDPHLVATAFLAHSTDLLARTAALLGEDDDAAYYAKVFEEVRTAFVHEYVTGSGLTASDSQTSYALALQFDLLTDPGQRRHAGERLARLVRRAGFRIATGFVGTPAICDALCETGQTESAFALLTQEECPSWLYPVLHGATTIWERWDGILPDGRVNPDQMNSLNHYAFGAVADWLQRTVGGLRPGEPGYRRVLIQPVPGGGITWARTRHRTPYGTAEVAWELDGAQLSVSAVVPPNTTATVVLPGRPETVVGSGTHQWTATT